MRNVAALGIALMLAAPTAAHAEARVGPTAGAPPPADAPPPAAPPPTAAPSPSGSAPPPGNQPPPASPPPESAPPSPAQPTAEQPTAEQPETGGTQDANGWETEPSEPPPAQAPQVAPPADSAPPPMSRSARLKADPELYPRYKKARSWAIGGGVTGAVGLVVTLNGLSLLLVDYVTPYPTEGPRQAGLVMTGIGVAALAAGTAIMGVGLHRRAGVLDELDAKATLSIYPTFQRDRAGMGLSMRF